MNKFLTGILVRGHQVASGPSAAYPYSSLEKQKPFFKALGLDLSPYFNGTLNISISPYIFQMTKPEFTFPLVEWTGLHPPETFSFSRCKVIFKSIKYPGWVYYPHPETKKNHFQDRSLLEVISHEVAGVRYGDILEVELNLQEVEIQ